jgi:HigB_toxin, RelE-like toxic component of a toxin-antitoxin system
MHLNSWTKDNGSRVGSIWRSPQHVKKSRPKASFLKGGRDVFNIKANDYWNSWMRPLKRATRGMLRIEAEPRSSTRQAHDAWRLELSPVVIFQH